MGHARVEHVRLRRGRPGRGGKPGQNQKGLVAFDRKTKKDAFYLYKAYLSKQPFAHICGSRYVDRPESETEIKVYSNQRAVTLYVDGKAVGTQRGEKVFRFRGPITGRHSILAKAGDCTAAIQIQKVDAPNPGCRKPGSDMVNWFDREDEIIREGRFSMEWARIEPGEGQFEDKEVEHYRRSSAAAGRTAWSRWCVCTTFPARNG